MVDRILEFLLSLFENLRISIKFIKSSVNLLNLFYCNGGMHFLGGTECLVCNAGFSIYISLLRATLVGNCFHFHDSMEFYPWY